MAENIKIENNIFEMEIEAINIEKPLEPFIESGIEITFLDNGNGISEYNEDYDEGDLILFFLYSNANINISFENYNFIENNFALIDLEYSISVNYPYDMNEYADRINTNYGDIENLYQQYLYDYYYFSDNYHYYININIALSSKIVVYALSMIQNIVFFVKMNIVSFLIIIMVKKRYVSMIQLQKK